MNNGYTNEQEAIRQSFANYLGALISASAFEGKIQKENVVALLCEELCKYVCDTDKEDDAIDMKTAKPILNASKYILTKHCNNINEAAQKANIDLNNSKSYNDLLNLIEKINNYILSIKE